jgi:predicted ATP-dependent endonuclease of OLD family
MLMDSFEVENFRSLKYLKLEKLARVNLLVGKNNSGKTSVLEAFYILTRIEESDWFDYPEAMRGMSGIEQDFRTVFYGFNATNTVRMSAYYRGAKRGLSKYRIQLESIIEHSARKKRKKHTALRVSIWIGSKRAHVFEMNREGEDTASYEPISDGAEEFLDEGLPEELSGRHDANFLSTGINLETLSEELTELSLNREVEILVNVMQQIDPRIVSMSLDAKSGIYFDLGEKFSMLSPINLMGEGVQRLLSIISSIASIPGGIILIDELDNGLHYSALRALWRGILIVAAKYDVQVFATTHSAEALRHLTWVLDDDCKDYRDDVAAYTLIRAKDDTVRSFRYDYEQLDFAMEHDMEVRN